MQRSITLFVVLLFVHLALPVVQTNQHDLTIKNDIYSQHKILQELQFKEGRSNIAPIVDLILEQLQVFMIGKGLDPMMMSDIHQNFSYKILLITYHGELDLTDGWLQDATTIYRIGAPKLTYDNKVINVEVPLGFKQFLLTYDYSAKIMSIGPSGSIEGRVQNVQVFSSLSIDLSTKKITLNDFKITKLGKIKLKFRGSILFDWLTNIFSGIFTTIFKGIIKGIAEDTIRGIIEEILNGFNSQTNMLMF